MKPSTPSDEQRAEQELMRLARGHADAVQQQLQMAVRAAGMGVWHVDLQSRKITTALGSGPLSGLDPAISPSTEEAFFALVHPEDREAVDKCLKRASKPNGVESCSILRECA